MFYIDYEDIIFLKQKLITGKVRIDDDNAFIEVSYDIDFNVCLINTNTEDKIKMSLSDVKLFCSNHYVANFSYFDKLKVYIIFYLNRFATDMDSIISLCPRYISKINLEHGYDSYYLLNDTLYYNQNKVNCSIRKNRILLELCGMSKSGKSMIVSRRILIPTSHVYLQTIEMYIEGKLSDTFKIETKLVSSLKTNKIWGTTYEPVSEDDRGTVRVIENLLKEN